VSSSVEALEAPRDRSDARLRVLAWAVFVLSMVGGFTSLYLDARTGRLDNDLWLLPFFAYPIVGLILATRLPHNPLGWLMSVAALGFMNPLESWAYSVVGGHGGSVRSAEIAMGISSPTWVLFIGLSGFMLLLFPDGHLPSRRWRWFAWACGVGLALLGALMLLGPTTFADSGLPQLRNPFHVGAVSAVEGPLLLLVIFAPAIVVGGAIGLIVRLRRTRDPVQRHQLRWVAWSAGVIAVAYLFAFVPNLIGLDGGSGWENILGTLAVMTFMLIPVTIGIGVLKYRLYDIDLVIRKTVIYAILALLIVGIGVLLAAVLVATAHILSSSVESGRLDLIIGVILGLLFAPLRRVATRIADRVVFGGRATPYEVLTEFGDRLAGTYAADDVLQRTAAVLGEGVGAARAAVWLLEGDELRPVATWTRATDEAASQMPDADDLRVEVRHQGELLGALSVAMPPNDPMDPTKEKLVRDLAHQAGLLLRNVRLVEDLRASRRRLVAAQDQERRRLERNIHDGAQQQLVALAVKARLARQLTERDPAKAADLLVQIEGETQTALEDLRDLARGIYPPLLADRGLVAAVEAQARKAPVPVTVHADAIGRFDQEAEAAAYFSILESLQNVAKYAAATRVDVEIRAADGQLRFEVADDGQGFDPSANGYGTGLQGIADRLGALDGMLIVESANGRGTRVSGRLPVTMPWGVEAAGGAGEPGTAELVR
jgi:signal transduction histidine kinase